MAVGALAVTHWYILEKSLLTMGVDYQVTQTLIRLANRGCAGKTTTPKGKMYVNDTLQFLS